MQDLVSIIVPVYNVAQYLERCLISLTGQTYKNIEIILVNDGSSDTSGTICDSWQSRDTRIKVFHKTNGGLSDARNYGLERAAGEYICFVDSDDWVAPKFVEVMMDALRNTGSDIAECNYVCTEGDVPISGGVQSPSDYRVFTGRNCFLHFLTNDFFVGVWNKLYRKKILQDRFFLKGVYHEDEYWTYGIFSEAGKVCRLNYTGYFYFQREGSIVHSKPTLKRITDAFAAGKERIHFIEQYYPEYASIGYEKMMYTCMFLYNGVRSSDIPQKMELLQDILSYFHIIWKKYLKKKQYHKEMWRFLLFSLFPNFYCSVNR